MIKHHPNCQLLNAYVKGELSASLSIGVAIHLQFCEKCQEQVNALTKQQAEISFKNVPPQSTEQIDFNELALESMLDEITADEQFELEPEFEQKQVSFNKQEYLLPRALNSLNLGRFSQLGKITRSRVKIGEDKIHASLLHIEAGGKIPEHTHKGYELTVLIDGSFSDEKGQYNKGDFILLDNKDTHNPVSEHGCLCYTVADDRLHFTQGVNRLLNPIGQFIY